MTTNQIMPLAYKRTVNAEAFEVEGEWVIMHADQYTITKLNELGGLIWTKLEQAQTSDSLVAEILDVYEISEQEARADVEAFVQELLRLGLIDHEQ